MRPSKPFMIERDGKAAGAPGDDYAKLNALVPGVRWVDWDGTHFATKAEADAAMIEYKITGAVVIEVLDEIRHTSGGSR